VCRPALPTNTWRQCLNYLRASGLTICLLVHFQKPKVEWRRIVLAFQIPEAPTVAR